MRTYDSYDMQTNGMFKKFSLPGDPIFAFEPDSEFNRLCTTICALFDRREIKSEKTRPTLEIGTAILQNDTEMPCIFRNDTGTPDWIRSSIAEYIMQLTIFSIDTRLYVGATEFDTWYGERPIVSDFSNDLLFIMANKQIFGEALVEWEKQPYGWMLPPSIPLFLRIRSINSEEIVLEPFEGTKRILPFSYKHTKKELFKMCAHNEIIINASTTSVSSSIVTNITSIQ